MENNKEKEMNDQELADLEGNLKKFLHDLIEKNAIYNLETIAKALDAVRMQRLGNQLTAAGERTGVPMGGLNDAKRDANRSTK